MKTSAKEIEDMTQVEFEKYLRIKNHTTANAVVEYRKYAMKKVKNGRDFKTFSEWKKTTYKGEK